MKKSTACVSFLAAFCLLVSGFSKVKAEEPNLADYTAYPVFLTQTVAPNILIMLDNSGSMNFNAYGSYPGDYGTVTDAPYGKVDVQVIQSEDDSEERLSTGANWYNHSDLDLGSFELGDTDPSMLGIRFQSVAIPQGAIVTSAYLLFEAFDPDDEITDYTIYGEAVDHAQQFTADYANISGRPRTDAYVDWEGEELWNTGNRYRSPDISEIVQEIVLREGWSSGNSMVFMIRGTGKRDAKSYDYSHSDAPRLVVEYDVVGSEHYYYGYFEPTARYSYASNRFYRDDTGPWSGNWLNWLCMRRIDILRKVLVGGLATSRTGGGNTTLYGETPAQTDRVFLKDYDGTEQDGLMTPYNDGVYTYQMEGSYIKVYQAGIYKDSYSINVEKDVEYEPQDFLDGNIAGVFQRVGDKARWGNEWFKTGTGNGQSGGRISNRVGTNDETLITDFENTSADTATPLAEAYYVATQYFKQEKPQTGLDYDNNAIGSINATNDPYYNGDEYVECAKSFVILLTDGASTYDSKIPDFLKDYDEDGDNTACDESTDTNCDYDGGGTDFLDDVALYARTTDLRDDLAGDQNLILYTIYAFGSDDNARSLIKDAARNGGFDDRNGNGVPDGTYTDEPEDRLEWDKDGDGFPDTYYEATDGYKLETELLRAITDILQRAASGTSASVLSTNREGDGTMIQAYFRPMVTVGTEDILWTGYLQNLWIDSDGNLREDTDGDHTLDSTQDRWVEYYQDEGTGDTRIRKHQLADEEQYEEVDLEEITPIWEAGKRLQARDPADRLIFTYLDKDKDQVIDEGSYDHTDDLGELVRFDTDTADQIKPYLGVMDGATWDYLGTSHDGRVENLINYIRGTDFEGMRTRTMPMGEATGVWKLGDIVNSTPVTVAAPKEEFDNLYSDRTYEDYYLAYQDRETIVISGGNDGMLHAFTSWVLDRSGGGQAFVKPTDEYGAYLPGELGDEIWAYIPQTLLPHLKWLADPNYTHVYYVDQEPYVFDARIFADDATHPNGWGTVLIVGLNMGGKYIWSEGDYDDGSGATVTETREFYPTYICMDVTEPREPRVLWERGYDGLGMSSSLPGILKVGRFDKGDIELWYAVIGSGYTDYDGTSDQPSRIFVVDLATGEPYLSGGNEYVYEGGNDSFFNRPITLDNDLNFETDAAYLAENYLQGGTWKATLLRLSTWDVDENPSLDPAFWGVSEVFVAPGPVTAPVSLGSDNATTARVWVYFGTGRFVSEADKVDDQQQYLIGFKDPLFNGDRAFTHDLLDISDLLDVTDYKVTTTGRVYPGFGACISWSELLDQVRMTSASDAEWTDGWYRALGNGTPSERCISKPTVLYGAVFVPTYIPNSDICGGGGETLMYAMYYETGTASYREMIAEGEGDTDLYCGTDGTESLVVESQGSGAPPDKSGVYMSSEQIKAFLQKSTGEVTEVDLGTHFKPRSRIVNWMER